MFHPAGPPSHVSYMDGSSEGIQYLENGNVSFGTNFGDRQDIFREMGQMLFPIRSKALARRAEFVWDTRLPDLSGLAVGEHFRVDGSRRVIKSTSESSEPFGMEGEVLRDEVIEIGSCAYPSRVFAIRIFVDGKATAEKVVHASLDLQITLQMETKSLTDDFRINQRVKSLE